MKEKFTRELVLAAPDLDKTIRVEMDTLDYVMGEMLFMECENARWRLVAFLSKSLNKTERNYEIYDKEILVVIRKLENWRHLLEGTKFEFKVWTNHKNLKYFIKIQKLNCRQAQWILYLSRFNFTLKHVSGTKIEKANGLRRRPDWKVGVEKDNDNQVLIKGARSKDKEIAKVVEEMKKTKMKVLQGDKWEIEGDLVLKEGKVYVLKDRELRAKIIWLHHDILVVRHGG